MTASEYRDEMVSGLLMQARGVLSALGGAGSGAGGFVIPHEDVMQALSAVETLIDRALYSDQQSRANQS